MFAYTSYCPVSSSDAVYEGYASLAGEVEFSGKVQFLRFDVALVPEVTKSLGVRVLPLTSLFWEGNCLNTVAGGNVEKIKLAVRHAYQSKYVTVTERERAEKEKRAGEEGTASTSQPSAKLSAGRAGSKPSTPSGGPRRSSSTSSKKK